MNPGLAFFTNHLWQSTLFTAAVWLTTLLLRSNAASLRHRLWLAASVKFLVPFSLLVGLGSQLPLRTTGVVAPREIFVVINPLAPAQTPSGPVEAPPQPPDHILAVLTAFWFCGFAGYLGWWFVRRERFRQIRRRSVPVDVYTPIPALSSTEHIEPCVFGVLRPVLLLPEGIVQRLTPDQFSAFIAHELCHVQRHDNVAISVHMFVEALFWFHPLVWWIGRRMLEEQERACDEEVLRQGSNPQVYAESILRICEFYISSPQLCVSITGSDVKLRIREIMRHGVTRRLSVAGRVFLTTAALLALAGPVLIGVAVRGQTPPLTDPPISYVASVKLNKASNARGRSEYSQGGRLTATAMPVAQLLLSAYNIKPYQLVGAPEWITTKRYDIGVKADDDPAPSLRQLLRALLRDRFALQIHNETRELPIFSLVVARGDGKLGPQLIKSDFDCEEYIRSPHDLPEPGRLSNCGIRVSSGNLSGKDIPISQVVAVLALSVGRFTVDKTGLTGGYDVELKWSPDLLPAQIGDTPTPDALAAPSIFTAIQEQLGLKLVSDKGPVSVLVVDQLKEPTEN